MKLKTGLTSVMAALTAMMGSAFAADYSSWGRYRTVTINTSAMNLAANVTNIPLLVRFTAASHKDMLDSTATQILANGADIRVTKADGVTDLPFEIERAVTGTGGSLALWVKADQVTANSANGFSFRVYWGKTGVTTMSNGGAVFDTANGYQAVFHLNEATGTLTDATKNGYSGTATGTATNTADAIIGAARTFGTSANGVSDATAATNFISFAPEATHKLSTHSGPITMEAWVRSSISNSSNTSIGNKTIVSHRSGTQEVAWLKRNGATTAGQQVYAAGGDTTNANGPYVPTGEANAWHYVVGSWDGTAWTVVRQRTNEAWGVKGDASPTVIRTVGGGAPAASTNPWFIGGMSSDGTTGGTVTRGWQGQIDEVRISTVARDTNYMKLSFETSKLAPTAVTIGATEIPSPPVGGTYANWTGHRDIILNTSATGANVAGNVTNFPVLVRLGTAEASILGAANGGNSIRFSKADDATALPYEIESWTSTSAAIWVKVDTVYGNNATQKIRMHWGNAAAASESNGNMVFDTANGFVGAWHLGNASGANPRPGSVVGSPAAQVRNGVAPVSGIIGMADTLSPNGAANSSIPTGRYIDLGRDASFANANYAGYSNFSTGFSYSMWVQPTANIQFWRAFVMAADSSGIVGASGSRFLLMGNRGDTNGVSLRWHGGNFDGVRNAFGVGQWTHLSFSKAPGTSTAQVYVNGQLYGTTPSTGDIPTMTRNGVWIGRSGVSTDGYFSGKVDNVTLAKTPRSADWVKLAYANQQATNTLTDIGIPVVTVPGQPTAVSAVAGDAQATVSWSAPADNGGSAITGYLARATQDTTKSCTSAANTTTCVVTGLANGTTYTFVVRAINAIGNGAFSTASNNAIPAAVVGGMYSAWSGHRSIVLNTSSTGANVAANVHNFPVLIRLNPTITAENDILTQGGTNGASIRFSKANDTTALPYQIESWGTTGAAIWVKVDTVRGNNSTQSIRLHWNNSAATSQSNASAVFDTAQYLAVWHLNDNGNQTDATGRGNTGTASTTAPTALNASVIGAGKTFNGSSNFYQIGTDSSALNLNTNQGPFTISAWVNPASCDTRIAAFSKYSNSNDIPGRQYALHTGNTATNWRFTVGAPALNGAGDAEFYADAEGTCVTNTWSQVVGTYRSAGTPTADSAVNAKIWVNGALAASGTTAGITGTSLGNASNTFIGRISTDERYMNGGLDEIRVAKVLRDSNWIKLEYANQKPINSLVNIGNPPLSVPGAPTGVTGQAGARGSASITVSWTAPASNGNSPITQYKAMVVNDTAKSCTSSGLSCTVSGLTAAASYQFVVKAINSIGASAASDPSAAVTAPTPVLGSYMVHADGFVRNYTFQLPQGMMVEAEDLKMTVTDVYGRTIWSKSIDLKTSKSREITWNGKTASGKQASAGIYIVRVQVGDMKLTRKASTLKPGK